MRRVLTLMAAALALAAVAPTLFAIAPAEARSRPPGFACWADERATTWTDQRQIVQGTPTVAVTANISTYPDASDLNSICTFPENSAGTVRILADPGGILLGEVPLRNRIDIAPARGMRFTGSADVSVGALPPGSYTIRTDYGIDQKPSGVPLTVIAPPPPPPPPTPEPPRPCSPSLPPGCPW